MSGAVVRRRMQRKARAVWKGTLKEGSGRLETESGAVKNVPYAFVNRFENEPGTNPEELIAAAHAGCFSMAFSNQLTQAGSPPESVETRGTITFEKKDAGWTLSASHLEVHVKVPNGDRDKIASAAEAAKTGCPVSRALNMPVSLELKIET
jgi:lipoyl-dependent peroxiredoxin